MKKISIIIPLYNTNKEYLIDCLNSILKQEFTNYEVIIIDDGSTEDYSNILNKFSFIKYIKTKNYGVSHARNVGIDNSNGEYIMFLDSDDYLSENSFKLFFESINTYKYDIVLSRNCIVESKEKSNYYGYDSSIIIENKDELYKSMMTNNNSKFSCVDTVWAKLYKRDFLLKNNIRFCNDLHNFEDVLFNYQCYYLSNNIYYLNELTYYYRVNNYSTCRSFQEKLFDCSLKFIHNLNEFIKSNNIDDNFFPQYVFRIVIRLFRKYFIYLDLDRLDDELYILLNDSVIAENLDKINKKMLDTYKQSLIELLKLRDIKSLKQYLNDVCKKGLLLK